MRSGTNVWENCIWEKLVRKKLSTSHLFIDHFYLIKLSFLIDLFFSNKGKIEAAKDSLRCLFGSSYNVDDHILKIRNGLLNSHRLDEGEEKKPLKVSLKYKEF